MNLLYPLIHFFIGIYFIASNNNVLSVFVATLLKNEVSKDGGGIF